MSKKGLEKYHDTVIGEVKRRSPRSLPLVDGLLQAYQGVADVDKAVNVKVKDVGFGLHGPASQADTTAQEVMIDVISRHLPDVKFIVEEGGVPERQRELILGVDNYTEEVKKGQVVLCDPIDGSTLLITGKSGWGMTTALMNQDEIVAGAIYEPESQSIVFGTVEEAFAIDFFNKVQVVNLREVEPKHDLRVFLVGVDFIRKPEYQKVLWKMGEDCTTLYTAGSCAVGIKDVLAGKADILFQPEQHPWDWAGGYPLLRAIGGKIVFFKVSNGKIELFDAPRVGFFHPQERKVGFVMGRDLGLVDYYAKILVRRYDPTLRDLADN